MLEKEEELHFFGKKVSIKEEVPRVAIFVETCVLVLGLMLTYMTINSGKSYIPTDAPTFYNGYTTDSFASPNTMLSDSTAELRLKVKAADLRINSVDNPTNAVAVDAIDIILNSEIKFVASETSRNLKSNNLVPTGNNLYLNNINRDLASLQAIRNYLFDAPQDSVISEKTKEGLNYYFKGLNSNLNKIQPEYSI